MNSITRWIGLLPAVGLIVCLGCGGPAADYSMVDLVNAGGTITLDGAPLSGAVVIFEDLTDETFSYAMTDSAGKYALQFDSEMKGVKTGRKIVRVSTTKKILGLTSPASSEGEDPDSKPSNKELVPAKYNKESTLEVEVTNGSVQFDFDLQTK